MLHLLGIVQSSREIDIVISGSSLPQHDTSKRIRIQVYIGLNQRLHLFRTDVEPLSSSTHRRWKTNEKLCIGVHGALDDIDPVIKVEVASVFHEVPRRTALGVVELNPDEVECSAVDGKIELQVREWTLRRSRDIEFLIGIFFEAVAELVDHGGVS